MSLLYVRVLERTGLARLGDTASVDSGTSTGHLARDWSRCGASKTSAAADSGGQCGGGPETKSQSLKAS